MKGPISLAQELRAIRRGNGDKNGDEAKPMPDCEESERPWREEIDQVQQTMRELLEAVASLSGVELPGVAPDSSNSGNPLPQLNYKTLKDRIRNDLEAFSVTTAAEVAKQAEEQARAVLGAVQSEVDNQIEQVAGEFREKLQGRLQSEQVEIDLSKESQARVAELVQNQTDEFARWVWLTCKGTGTPIPAQIEKLLEPYVEEASAKVEAVFQQKVQDLLAKQEQSVHDRYQGIIDSFQSQLSSLEQTAQQICRQSVESVTKLSEDRLNAAADEAARNLEAKIQGHAQEELSQFHTRLNEMASTWQEGLRREQDLQAEGFRQRLEGLVDEVQKKSVSEVSGRIERTAADVMESSFQHLHQQADDALEHSKDELKGFMQLQADEVREQFRGVGRSIYESLSQDAAKLADTLRGLDQDLTATEQKHLAASAEQLSSMSQATMESLAARIKQIADTQLGEINKFVQDSQAKAAAQCEAQLHEVAEGRYNSLLERLQKEAEEAGSKVAAEVKTTSESVMQELSDKVNASASVLREEAIQASAHIESSVKNSLETYRQQLAQITGAGLEEHRKAVTDSMADLHNRLKQAAGLLTGHDSGN